MFPGHPQFGGRLSDGRPHTALKMRGPSGSAALTGVHMRFDNGGHFIAHLGVKRHSDGFAAWFQDGQSRDDLRWPDDPFRWEMGYVMLALPSQSLRNADP